MIHVEIITPEQTVYDGDVDAITLPTGGGEITVLPGHVALITTLVPGVAFVRREQEESMFAVSRGVIEIDGKSVRVLADIADRAESLEEQAIEKAKADAERMLAEKRYQTDAEFAEAAAMLEKEIARLKTVRRHRSRRRYVHEE